MASEVERHLRARGIASLTTEALNDARKDSAGRYRGDVGINLTLKNIQNQRMVFIPVRPGTVLGENDYRSFDNVLSGQQIVAAENVEGQMNQTLQSVISQVCWSFWQSADPFPDDELEQYLGGTIRDSGTTLISPL